MAQIQIRDEHGQPIPGVTVFVTAGNSVDDKFTDGAGNTAFPWRPSVPEYTIAVNTHDDQCGRGLMQKYEAVTVTVQAAELDVDYLIVLKRTGGGHGSVDDHRPRRGASLYGLYGDPGWDYQTFAHQLSDAGLISTDAWCFGGWTNWGGRLPFQRRSDGKWDLFAWNDAAFDDAEAIVRYMNSYGIRVRFTIVDLYVGISDRKQGLPGIPDARTGPFRPQNNVNNVDYSGDNAFYVVGTAGDWVTAYAEKFVGRLKGLGVDFQTANESPESAMHDRIRDAILRSWPEAHVSSSRNSDAPSEYMNMVDVHRMHAINFHGWKNLTRMDESFHEPSSTGRPDTYRQLLNTGGVDPKRIIACSDGARNGNSDPRYAYDWADLLKAFAFATDHGCNIDHQSAAKMALFTYGTHDLSYVETDFLRQIAAL
jgi:hypothetical protein